MHKYFLFIFCILIACKNNETTTSVMVQSVPQDVQFDSIVVSKTFGNPDSMHFSEFKLNLPILKKGDPIVCKRINDSLQLFIQNALKATFWEGNPLTFEGKNFDQISDDYNNIISKTKRDESMGNQSQSFDYHGNLILVNKRIISFAFDFYTYSGGAHGYGGTTFKNYSLEDGAEIRIKDYILDTLMFNTIVKAAFYSSRKEIAVKEKIEYDPNGYFFDNVFTLPLNIGFNAKGMIFNYLPYEAASYAEGNLSFEIPYEKLKGIVKDISDDTIK